MLQAGSLDNRHLSSRGSKHGCSQTKVPAERRAASLVDDLLPALPPHILFDREQESPVVRSFEDSSPAGLGPTLMTHFTWMMSLKALATNAATSWVRASACGLGWGHNSMHNPRSLVRGE